MQLTVIEYAGEPVRTETSVMFHAPGGTIGRNADNQMVLPDETRQVSRLQALLQIDGEHCVLKNLSSVSVVEINDTPLEYTEEHALASGDAIRIGPYVLRAHDGEDVEANVEKHVKENAPIPTDPLALFARPSGNEAKRESTQTQTQTPPQTSTQKSAQRPAPEPPPTPASRIDARATTFAETRSEREFSARPPLTRAYDQASATATAASTPTRADAPTPSAAPDSADALLSAFLRGAGLDKATCDWQTEQLHTAGQLLALFANGTVELLSSRSILKREVKADMTVLLDRENNPLKLLPDGSAALRQMFGLPFPGFMTPPGAVEDAFHDLQAHQIAMVAGMRAALNDVLLRFSPERLAARDTPSRYEAFLPVLRKLRLWNRYERLHHETMLAVEDDFSAVFGRSFLRAYDEEVRSYHARRRPARASDA
ncbi:type VI secretion system-associated FHA domain protein TagH [Paraburkholderia sacchari]|uniref:type VI secretion system-associated FHA domain protein TagH n=1 Tax=Paraburkholderia sacchari TaxID=159450 RepID=UPI0005437D21|nr:type VI secretion system-associated FHA domain protein TagH [Paraburkholderia sacchari]NLP62992.1 type VI secretion system-associated FHA domain protein TagH [Paraburkholderia sacchari]